jgi:hypothetical protein
VGKSVKKLLRGPFCGWMRRNVEVNDAAPLMRQDKEDVENAERDRRNGEEIDRGKLFGVVLQKCAPCLRWRFWMPEHVFGDSRLGNADSELEQLSMNRGSSPGGIIFAHGADEFANILGNPRSSRFAVLAFPGSKQSESLAMPGDDGLRFNNDKSRAPLGLEP